MYAVLESEGRKGAAARFGLAQEREHVSG
jgi:hypothetical protein